MSEEIVSHDGLADLDQNGKVLLAGWPTDRVSEMYRWLRQIGPKLTPSTSQHPDRPNPFTDRIAVPRSPSDVDLIKNDISRDQRSTVLIFIEELASILARKLSQDSKAGLGYADEWEAATDRLLAMADHDPSRVKIILTNDALFSPFEFVEYLSKTLSLPLAFFSPPEITRRNKWDDFYLMVANRFIQEKDQLNRLTKQLALSRDFVPTGAPWGNLDWSAVVDDVETMRSENCALLEMLHKVQLEFENTMVELGEAQDQLKEQKDRQATLDDVRQALDQEQLRSQQLQAKLQSEEKSHLQTQQMVQAIFASTSWKVTAPIRGLVEKIRG